MPVRSQIVALDSQTMTYLIQANTGGYDPETDPDQAVAAERLAMFRIFLHVEYLLALPTAMQEAMRNPDLDSRSMHYMLGAVHLMDRETWDQWPILERAEELTRFHRDEDDCRVVAEAELGGADVLLTFDEDLPKHLQPRCPRLQILTPTAYWQSLAIPKGATPARIPHPTHPLHAATWWLW